MNPHSSLTSQLPRRFRLVFTSLAFVFTASAVQADNPRYGRSASQSAGKVPKAVTGADYHMNGEENAAQVALGQSLFFDKILSGNFNISCATCHHPMAGTGDGLSLPVGEGGVGLGITRLAGDGETSVHERVPRNAPHIFNIGAREFTRMFHDGRVEIDPSEPTGFRSPAGEQLPHGLDNVVAVQAMFPVTSGTEMAGQEGENEIADAAAASNLGGEGGVWDLLAQRLQGVDAYVEAFTDVYDDVSVAEDITFVHAANAIAAFEISAGRADQSPFDRHLRGDKIALSSSAKRGMKLFYGKAGCADCHSGKFQTNHEFHAIGMPQLGPGKGDGDAFNEDFGRYQVSKKNEDLFCFRTPSLRNVTLTAPYGHSGAFDSLEAVVRHHLDPTHSLMTYHSDEAVLPCEPDLDEIDFAVVKDSAAMQRIAGAIELAPVKLSDKQFSQLMDFLYCLTDPRHVDMRRLVPKKVLSGISVFD